MRKIILNDFLIKPSISTVVSHLGNCCSDRGFSRNVSRNVSLKKIKSFFSLFHKITSWQNISNLVQSCLKSSDKIKWTNQVSQIGGGDKKGNITETGEKFMAFIWLRLHKKYHSYAPLQMHRPKFIAY